MERHVDFSTVQDLANSVRQRVPRGHVSGVGRRRLPIVLAILLAGGMPALAIASMLFRQLDSACDTCMGNALCSVRIVFDQQAIHAVCRRWGVTELDLFGSVVRDDF